MNAKILLSFGLAATVLFSCSSSKLGARYNDRKKVDAISSISNPAPHEQNVTAPSLPAVTQPVIQAPLPNQAPVVGHTLPNPLPSVETPKSHFGKKLMDKMEQKIAAQLNEKQVNGKQTVSESNVLEGNLKKAVLWGVISIVLSAIGWLFWPFYILSVIAWIICIYYLYKWLINDSGL